MSPVVQRPLPFAPAASHGSGSTRVKPGIGSTHRRKGDCADIELLQPIGPLDAAAFRAQVAGLQPTGMTPIAASVRQAAEALRYTERKATVILVGDGEETCNADPCSLGVELGAQGVDFTAHVVGFDLEANPKAREQSQCLVQATGGRYFDARDAGELDAALAGMPASRCRHRGKGIRAR